MTKKNFLICDMCLKVCYDYKCTECGKGEMLNEISGGVCLKCWPRYIEQELDKMFNE